MGLKINSNKSKVLFTLVLILLLTLLLSSLVLGGSDWNGINNAKLGNTQNTIYYSSFNSSITEYNYDTDVYSLGYAPSSIDINLDGINELIGYSSGNINIYNGVNNNLNLLGFVNVGTDIKNFAPVKSPFGVRGIAVLTDTDLFFIKYENGGYTKTSILNGHLGSYGVINSNLACDQDVCAFTIKDGNRTTIYSYYGNWDDTTSLSYSTRTYYDVLDTNTTNKPLIVSVIDSTYIPRISFIDKNTSTFVTLNYDLNDLYENSVYVNTNVYSYDQRIALYKNYLGYTHLSSNNGDSAKFYVIDITTGTQVINYEETSNHAINGEIGFINNNGNIGLLSSFSYYFGSQKYRTLIKYFNGTIVNLDSNNAYNGNVVSGNINLNEFGIVMDNTLFNSTSVKSTNFNGGTGYKHIITDISGDDVLEVIAYKAGSMIVGFSNSVVNPNTIRISSADNGGYTGYYSPICLGTTINFSAKECIEYPYLNCNYFNAQTTINLITGELNIVTPNDEKERIYGSCYGDTNYSSGSYSDTIPKLSCTYNEEGNYSLRLYLQSESNPNDFSQYNYRYINISVVNGTSGIDCNINAVTDYTFTTINENITNVSTCGNGVCSGTETILNCPSDCAYTPTPTNQTNGSTTTSNPNAIGGGIDVFFEMLTGGAKASSSFKLMIGILIILGCVIGVSFYVSNFAVILIVGSLALVFTTAIGLIPIYVLILMIILVIGGIALNKFMSSGGGN
jgi:hypothetical protein